MCASHHRRRHNTLTLVTKAEVCDAKVLDIILERHALESGIFLFNKGFDVFKVFAGRGGDVLRGKLESVIFIFFSDEGRRAVYIRGQLLQVCNLVCELYGRRSSSPRMLAAAGVSTWAGLEEIYITYW
jgi:hypothetical protein